MAFFIGLLFFCCSIRTEAARKYSYKVESNNSGGLVVTVKSKMDYAIQGKVKVTFYTEGKKIKSKTKTFHCTKAYMLNFEAFDDWGTYYEGCTYKVSISDVKKSVKRNAASKMDIAIKRKNHKSEGTADIVATITNTSKKSVKYKAFLAMRYDGNDALGEDCKGRFYDYVQVSGTLKPGKKKTFKGLTWYDYKIKSKVYLDCYYVTE